MFYPVRLVLNPAEGKIGFMVGQVQGIDRSRGLVLAPKAIERPRDGYRVVYLVEDCGGHISHLVPYHPRPLLNKEGFMPCGYAERRGGL